MSTSHTPKTAEEILAQLKKEGVTDLQQFAEFLIRKTRQEGDPEGEIVNSALLFAHGFVSH